MILAANYIAAASAVEGTGAAAVEDAGAAGAAAIEDAATASLPLRHAAPRIAARIFASRRTFPLLRPPGPLPSLLHPRPTAPTSIS